MVDGGELLIHRFPAPFVTALASLDETGTNTAATEWVKLGELAFLSCPPDAAKPVIDAASRLARMAQRNGKSLYMFMCV